MCGIAGKLFHDPARPVDGALLDRMSAILAHRGPDDAGIHHEGSVGLVSRRLAIQDLSAAGHQPMSSPDGRLWITYNGEIYNFLLLRDELERDGVRFRSRSDTEVILALYARQGPACLARLRGMFALAIWDRQERTLFAARDRLGKKPLFYYQDADRFVFASEPKAILQDPEVPVAPDHVALHHYLTYGYVPGPWSAFRGVRKLPPAHYLVLRDGRTSLHRYWELRHTPKRTDGEAALTEELLARLGEAVRLRLISDVPVGALLSGGLDSSAVVAMIRRATSGPIRTFSIGFDRPDYDETRYARLVAQHLGTEHHEAVVKPDAVAGVPRLVWHYSEPFADSSALPSLAVCEMARGFVTVALNGDGGDETFLGYDRYLATAVLNRLDWVPRPVRALAGAAGRGLPRGMAKSLAYRLRRVTDVLTLEPRDRYAKWMTAFGNSDKGELYAPALRQELRTTDSLALLDAAYEASDATTFVERIAHTDVQLYLPDDLLVKMDIASMANSLEVRSPFLDHEVVEFAASLPLHLKLRGWTQKYLLRRAMRGLLPEAVIRRPKMGFGVPIDHWFRHELREMAYDVLLDARARQRGYFRPDVVRRYLDEHVEGRAHHHPRLWSLLMLEQWHRVFIDARPAPSAAPAACGA
jgi:asparagine synthase (glutamine-hydrolysing)